MKPVLQVTVSLSILLGSSNLLAQAGSPSESSKNKSAEEFFEPDEKVSLTPDQNDIGKAKELIVPGSAPIVTIDIPDIGPAPESHVLDEGRVFNAEKLAKITKLLKDPTHGLEFYITAHTMLPDENIEKYPRRLGDNRQMYRHLLSARQPTHDHVRYRRHLPLPATT
jgi:hypothetical protein